MIPEQLKPQKQARFSIWNICVFFLAQRVTHIKAGNNRRQFMNVCVRERGRTGVTVIDSHLLMQGHNYKLQLSPWKHVPMVTWGGFRGHNMILCVCLWGFSVAPISWGSIKHIIHTELLLFLVPDSSGSIPTERRESWQGRHKISHF